MTAGGTPPVPPLSFQRMAPAEWQTVLATATSHTLGGLVFGDMPGASQASVASGTPSLSPRGAVVDAWFSDGPLARGQCGSVRWVHNGHWLFGTLALDEAIEDAPLAELSARVYADVFDTLSKTGCGHLLRLWNYLPGINADAGGMERYRQFNSGRQKAFLEARQAAFEGAPAACALGTRDGPLRVHFLAGRRAALPLENPRQTSAYHYPRDYGPHSPTFSRAALADAGGGQVALLISGTSSIVGHETVHAGDAVAQTVETLTNLRAVIDAAHQRCNARFDLATAACTLYVRRADDAPVIRQIFDVAVGAESPAARHAVVVQADICRADLLVEIEAHAFASGEVIA
jgi:chorismate lyase / 3-hydroxybenzoate synthase